MQRETVDHCVFAWPEPWELDVPCQSEASQCPDSVPIQVKLVPDETVTRRPGAAWWLLRQPSPKLSIDSQSRW
jgi:hypothetical protein